MIHSDGALTSAELCLDTARVLRGAGPWGQGFPEPIFDGEFHIADSRVVGGRHLKMRLKAADISSGGGSARGADLIEAIAFGYIGGGTEDPQVRSGARIHLAYRLEINDFRGNESLQLNCQQVCAFGAMC